MDELVSVNIGTAITSIKASFNKPWYIGRQRLVPSSESNSDHSNEMSLEAICYLGVTWLWKSFIHVIIWEGVRVLLEYIQLPLGSSYPVLQSKGWHWPLDSAAKSWYDMDLVAPNQFPQGVRTCSASYSLGSHNSLRSCWTQTALFFCYMSLCVAC